MLRIYHKELIKLITATLWLGVGLVLSGGVLAVIQRAFSDVVIALQIVGIALVSFGVGLVWADSIVHKAKESKEVSNEEASNKP